MLGSAEHMHSYGAKKSFGLRYYRHSAALQLSALAQFIARTLEGPHLATHANASILATDERKMARPEPQVGSTGERSPGHHRRLSIFRA